jgi:hypothetical protein
MSVTPLWCIFPDKEEALTVARYLSGNPDVMELPPDGWLRDLDAEGNEIGRTYYNIAAFGEMYEPVLNEDGTPSLDAEGNPEMALLVWTNADGTTQPGYCLIGLWHGEFDTVPFPLQAFMVTDLPVQFG